MSCLMKAKTPTAEIVETLGGTRAVAELTGVTYSAVANWIMFEKFPPNTYVMMKDELEKLGLDAPPALWKMKLPEDAS
jgi:hypothetical protein